MTGYINTIRDLEAQTYGINNLPAGNALLKQAIMKAMLRYCNEYSFHFDSIAPYRGGEPSFTCSVFYFLQTPVPT